MRGQWADRGPSQAVHCAATPAEEQIFEELAHTLAAGGRAKVGQPMSHSSRTRC